MIKILVSLPEEIVNLLDGELKGRVGETRSVILRSIVTSWLSEKGYLSKGGKNGKE